MILSEIILRNFLRYVFEHKTGAQIDGRVRFDLFENKVVFVLVGSVLSRFRKSVSKLAILH